MPRRILSTLFSFTILLVAIFSVQRFSSMPIGSTTIWWLIEFLIVGLFIGMSFGYYIKKKVFVLGAIEIFLLYNIFSIIRGVFAAETYWDMKGLVENTFSLLLPFVIYIAIDKDKLQSILSFFVKYVLPLSFIILIPVPRGGWGIFLAPISLLLLLLPVMKLHWKLVLIGFSALAIFGDLSTRSFIFKYGVPILILCLYYLRFFISFEVVIRLMRVVFLLLPWILFLLGVSGYFNVFKIKDYVKKGYVAQTTNAEGEVKQQDVTDDSRTFMYEEVLHSAKKYNYWWLGRSPARGNETVAFADQMLEITGRNERLRNEANIPNIFTWLGVIGVVIYFILFYRATYLAIYRSNNIFSKLIGLFVSFRWLYAWIEDYYNFDINNLVLFMLVGICFSSSFRKMNNLEVKIWARGIFNKKYVKFLHYLEGNMTKKIPDVKKVIYFEDKVFS